VVTLVDEVEEEEVEEEKEGRRLRSTVKGHRSNTHGATLPHTDFYYPKPHSGT
jgi:hypothetical protein